MTAAVPGRCELTRPRLRWRAGWPEMTCPVHWSHWMGWLGLGFWLCERCKQIWVGDAVRMNGPHGYGWKRKGDKR